MQSKYQQYTLVDGDAGDETQGIAYAIKALYTELQPQPLCLIGFMYFFGCCVWGWREGA